MHLHKADNHRCNNEHLWGMVLVGGQDKNSEHFTSSRYGTTLPKRYSAFHAMRSMLSNTLSRVELLVPREHIVVAIPREQLNHAAEDLIGIPVHNIVVQPMNRETEIGIIHTLLHIYHKDPQAIVAIFPSDHLIFDDERFMEYVDHGVTFVNQHSEQLLILGVEPEQPDSGYGWIKPGEKTANVGTSVINRVTSFWEKSSMKQTLGLYEQKYLLNTMVFVCSAHTMISRFYQLMPDIVSALMPLRKYYYTPFEYEETRAVYNMLPLVNSSYSILQSNVEEISVLRVKGVYWSDLGNPDRGEKEIAHRNGYNTEDLYWCN